MNRNEFLKVKNTIENNIKDYFKSSKSNYNSLQITKVKIYKKIALVEYYGDTFEGFKLINLKTLNIISCKISVLKKISIEYPGGGVYPGYIKTFTNSYDDTLKLLLKCYKSNDNIKIYKFKKGVCCFG